MRRREFIALVCGAAIANSPTANAQQSTKIYRIGILSAGAPPLARGEAAFIAALQELGWIEGKNIVFEYRHANNDLDRLPALAAELVELKVDVIVTRGTLAPLATKQATSTIPIVMASAGDPVGTGIITSLARPGGNITGLTVQNPELAGKRLELLKEVSPTISRVAVLWNGANPDPARVFKEMEGAAAKLDIQLLSVAVRGPADFEHAFAEMTHHRLDALITVDDPLTFAHRKDITDFASKRNLPSMHGLREFAEVGGLIAYGQDIADARRRSASYVDKILKGAKPADLPVEQPTKFHLVINLKTAKALGLAIPATLLARADEVIE
jgi:putative tryptophan/tyrosine transport system substrate-binding protein